MNKSLISVAADVASDAVSVLGIPNTALRSLLGSWFQKQMDDAFNILIEELRAGNIDELHAASQDDAVAVIFRYALAVREGAARRNLKLLAKAICGLAQRDRLHAEDFNKYADILSRLTRDQIFLLGQYMSRYREWMTRGEVHEAARNNAFKDLLTSLTPHHFESREHILSTLNQSTALGLIVPVSAWGGLVYNISPLLEEISALIPGFSKPVSEED